MRTTTTCRWVFGSLGFVLLGLACIARAGSGSSPVVAQDLQAPLQQWRLPKRLREVSGLAVDERQRLFAHDDEHAVIYQLDWRKGRIVKHFSVGHPAVAGDFEGLAIGGDWFYLVDSGGTLLRFAEGDDDSSVDYSVVRTGLDSGCEVEGLDYDVVERGLLLACKSPRAKGLVVHYWSLAQQRLVAGLGIVLGAEQVEGLTGSSRFAASAIVRLPASGGWLLTSARQNRLLELSPGRTPTGLFRLDSARHPQPEGLAVDAAGHLFVADEGRDKRGRLTVYAAIP